MNIILSNWEKKFQNKKKGIRKRRTDANYYLSRVNDERITID